MLEEKNINLKDSPSPTLPKGKGEISFPLSLGEGSGVRHSKANKLITALYMVTDIMDKDEPIRLKLRTLGVEILSDMNLNSPLEGCQNGGVDNILSLLEIASTIGMISEMNCNILKKEFTELKKSIQESEQNLTLSEFFGNSPLEEYPTLVGGGGKFIHPVSQASHPSRGELNSKRHNFGIQKGNTLLKAIKKVGVSDKNLSDRNDFNILKNQRRDEIIKIVQNKGNATITDIRNEAKSLPAGRQGVLASCGEKTLQRELVSMVKDGVLKKVGEKRWSRYFIK